jgi:hypothetical protein
MMDGIRPADGPETQSPDERNEDAETNGQHKQ